MKMIGRETHEIAATFIQVYGNIFEILGKLDLLSIFLLHYLGTRMEEDSCVHFNICEKKRFIEEVRLHSGKLYRIGSVDNALQKLKKTRVIRSVNNASFLIDPLYITKFINDDERKRRVILNEQWKFQKSNNVPIYSDPINEIKNHTTYSAL
jgi:hypothetical protein